MTAPSPDQILDALDRLDEAIATAPALAGLKATDCLRLIPGARALFRGRLGGREVVIRLHLRGDAAAQIEAQWAELQRIAPHMTGPNAVPAPLAVAAAHGVMVTRLAPGGTLLSMLSASDPSGRAALLRRAAGWLRDYTAPSLTTRKCNTDPWLMMAAGNTARQPHADLAAAEADILHHMQTLASDAGWTHWRAAISHGDYHPGNLLLDGETLTGIDTGGSAYMPIYKDIARHLAHLARRGLFVSDARRHGVDAAALDIFAEIFALSDDERTRALPFFIGFEILARTERADMPGWRLRLARELAAGYLGSAT